MPLGSRPNLTMPSVSVTVGEQIEALVRVAGSAAAELIVERPDPAVQAIVGGWPERFEPTRALDLGFRCEADYDQIIHSYLTHDAPEAALRTCDSIHGPHERHANGRSGNAGTPKAGAPHLRPQSMAHTSATPTDVPATPGTPKAGAPHLRLNPWPTRAPRQRTFRHTPELPKQVLHTCDSIHGPHERHANGRSGNAGTPKAGAPHLRLNPVG